MKKIFTTALFAFGFLGYNLYAAESDKFIVKIHSGTELNAALYINGKNYTIEWEQVGSESTVNGSMFVDSSGPALLINLPLPNFAEYRLKIDPTTATYFNSFKNNSGRLNAIEQWGTAQWSTMASAFMMNPNLKVTATDIPDFSNCTSLYNTFSNCTNLEIDSSINSWDVSNIVTMSAMFSNCLLFNSPIGDWDVSNVTNMSFMFQSAQAFNQYIGGWNTENLSTLQSAFNNAKNFNQNIGGWDLSNVFAAGFVFDNSGMDCNNYSNTLIGWANNSNTPSSITMSALNVDYNEDGMIARNYLIDSLGWTINGDNLDVDCPTALFTNEIVASAQLSEGNVQLDWRLISKNELTHFVIMHSADGINFQHLTQVDYLPNTQEYSWIDNSSKAGAFYQVIGYNNNEIAVQSKIMKVENNVKSTIFSIKGNPILNQTLNIDIYEPGELIIYNSMGNSIYKQIVKVGQNNFSLANLPKGMYFVQLNNQSDKIIIQ